MANSTSNNDVAAGNNDTTIMVVLPDGPEGGRSSTTTTTSTAIGKEQPRAATFLEEHGAWVKFVPALLVWPVWLYTMLEQDLWKDVFEYWPMTIAMIAGSFIAGSTPLGGGVIAFPVSVLVLKFTPVEARDISVLIQSVGMNAAAYLLFVTKPHLLNPELIISFCFTGVLGLLIGFLIEPKPKIINTLYTVLVFEFGIIFFYTNVINPAAKKMKALTTASSQGADAATQVVGPLGNGRLAFFVGRGLMVAFGVAGGIITSTIGSGSDITLFLFGLYAWNIIYPNQRYSENVFTASSVVVMGVVSLATAMIRVLNAGFNDKTVFTWGAMVPIVVVGAPVGSIVIGPKALPYLRAMFYILACVQFVFFSTLKIKKQIKQWISIVVVSVVVLSLLTLHYNYTHKTLTKQEQLQGEKKADAAKVEEGQTESQPQSTDNFNDEPVKD